jgi:inorganic triphosphatase YgiF
MAETEFKYSLPSAGRHTLLGELSRLAGMSCIRRQITSTYFDTADFALARARLTLRLRRYGRGWLQCLKGGGQVSADGLHVREEWEYPTPRREIDLSCFRGTPLAALPQAQTLHRQLAAVFATRFTRCAWRIPTAAGEVEAAIDSGIILSRGSQTLPILELELELLGGATLDDARRIAAQLGQRVCLRPQPQSKAARGYRLAGAQS